MCFSSKAPKTPAPPPVVSARDQEVQNADDSIRRRRAALAGQSKTIVGGRLGASNFGQSVGTRELGGGTSLGG